MYRDSDNCERRVHGRTLRGLPLPCSKPPATDSVARPCWWLPAVAVMIGWNIVMRQRSRGHEQVTLESLTERLPRLSPNTKPPRERAAVFVSKTTALGSARGHEPESR